MADYLLLTGPSDTFLTRLKLGLANSGSCTAGVEPREDSPVSFALISPLCQSTGKSHGDTMNNRELERNL